VRRGATARTTRTLPALLLVALLLAAGCAAAATPTTAPPPSPSPTPSPTPSVHPTPSPTSAPSATPRASPAPPDDAFPPQLATELQATLDAVREKERIPGVEVAVLRPDGRLWVATSGLADLGARRPVTPDTVFVVASVTKTFVAALVLELASEGRLDLDDPLSRWLPAWPNAGRITVRQLLGHTSGIRDFFESAALRRALDADHSRAWTAGEVLRYVGRPYFAPGEGYHYSNTNYVLLGLVAERASGRPVADEIRRRFLAPLGLDRTWFQAFEKPRDGVRAHGYEGKPPAPRDVTGDSAYLPFTSLATAVGTAGAMVSTAGDLARWAGALYGGQVLPPGALEAMLTFTERPTYHYAYGLGAISARIGALEAWGHGGRLSGFTATVRYFPRARLTIVALTNQARVNPDVVVTALLRLIPRYESRHHAHR